jgi:hypothetical protein
MSESGHLSIWFFVGVLLTIYGVLIVGAGLYGFAYPPDVKLADKHADLWWGGLLLLAGLFYTYRFFPKTPTEPARKP